MKGKTVVITGGNTGIGKEAAVGLAEQGAHVIITSRDPARGEAAVAEVRERTGADGEVEVMTLDLASLASIREFAAALGRRQDHLDVLLNNAGAVLLQRQVTVDGFERTFGVNHLGHFVLTDLLLDQLRASAPARVVNVSSRAHKSAKTGLDFEDLQAERKYQPFLVYGRSKLANIYFTRELARRLEGTGITTNALHPGFVRSDFGRDGDLGKGLGVGITIAQRLFAIGPERGARTSIYLASSPDVDDVSGRYFVRCKPAAISKAAADDNAARRLWSASEELVGGAA